MTDSKAERETIVRFSDDPDEPLTVYTFRETAAKKLLKAGATLKRTGTRDGKAVNWTLELPREWFRWPRKPRGARAGDAERGRALAQNRRQGQNDTSNPGLTGDKS